MAFVGSLGLLLVESSERCPATSLTSTSPRWAVVAQVLVFPAVTSAISAAPVFSRLTTNDLYHAGETAAALLDVNLQIPDPHLADPTVLEALPAKGRLLSQGPAVQHAGVPARVGHDLKDMMLYCKFKGAVRPPGLHHCEYLASAPFLCLVLWRSATLVASGSV